MTQAGGAPLAGRRVIVPVTATHRGLADAIAALGAQVDPVHFIAIEGPADPSALADAALRWANGEFAWLAATSRNGVAGLAGAAARAGVDASSGPGRVAAAGAATALECARHGLSPDLASEGDGAAGLVAAFPIADGEAARVLAPLGNLAARTLVDGLTAKGWTVEAVEAYRTVDGPGPDSEVAAALADGRIDAVLVTSASVARRVADVWPAAASGTMVVAIGAASAAGAASAGLPVTAVAEAPTREAMIAATVAALAPEQE